MTHDLVQRLRIHGNMGDKWSMELSHKAADRILVLESSVASRDAEVAELRNELETERMRNVACGVVAMADTPDSARWARDMHPDYMSASCSNVARRVDECIKLRDQVTLLRGAIGNIKNYAHKTDDVLRWCDEAIAATEPK